MLWTGAEAFRFSVDPCHARMRVQRFCRWRREAWGATPCTPIKHVITIIGENRSFDRVFGLSKPRHGDTISILLSKRLA
jgi:phospholipase C